MREAWVPRAWGAFEVAFRPWMRRRVGPVLLTGLPAALPADRPLLLCPNHASWWDGFLVRELQRALRPRAPLLTLMLASELRRRPWLALLGAVGLEPGSTASIRAALRRMEGARGERPDVVAAVFPQGRIRPPHARPLGFRPGVRAVARALAPATALPVALHVAFGREPRAVAYLSVGEPVQAADVGSDLAGLLEPRVEAELDALHAFLDRHGEDAPRAWPGPLGRLPRPPRPRRRLADVLAWPAVPVWPGRN